MPNVKRGGVVDLLESGDVGEPVVFDEGGVQRMVGVAIGFCLVSEFHRDDVGVVAFGADLFDDLKMSDPWNLSEFAGLLHETCFLR